MTADDDQIRADIISLATRTKPGHLDLTFGGRLAVSEHDDGYVLHVYDSGVAVTVRLSALDVWALRSLTGDLVIARLNETAPRDAA